MSNERVERLEERVVWLQRHVTEQDKAMLELHEELAKLRRDLSVFRLRLESTSSLSDGTAGASPADERPPHY